MNHANQGSVVAYLRQHLRARLSTLPLVLSLLWDETSPDFFARRDLFSDYTIPPNYLQTRESIYNPLSVRRLLGEHRNQNLSLIHI